MAGEGVQCPKTSQCLCKPQTITPEATWCGLTENKQKCNFEGHMSGSWEGVLLHISREKNRGGRLVLFSQDSEKNGCQGTHGTAARGCRTIAQDALPTSPVSQPSPVSLGGPPKNPSCQKAVPKAFRRFAPEPTLGPPTCYQGWAF